MLEFYLRFVTRFVPLMIGNELVVKNFVVFGVVDFVTTRVGKTLFVQNRDFL